MDAAGRLHVLLAPVLDPGSRTWWPTLIVAAVVAAAWGGPRAVRGLLPPAGAWPSVRAELALLLARRLGVLATGGAAAVSSTWLAARAVMWLDRHVGRPEVEVPGWLALPLVTLAWFVVADLSRFLLHRAMHRVPALWALHQVHHAAPALTPLTFHRIHPVEAALYAARGTAVALSFGVAAYWLLRERSAPAEILGVGAIGFVLEGVFGNLRHAHVPLSFGRWERWLLSPAQHQLHHSLDPAHHDANFGTWIALWDRWSGTWRPAAPVAAVGLAAPNHDPTRVWSMLVDPLVAIARGAR